MCPSIKKHDLIMDSGIRIPKKIEVSNIYGSYRWFEFRSGYIRLKRKKKKKLSKLDKIQEKQ